MAEAAETSKLTMGEEESMATARRLRGSYLEHRSIEVENDGAQAGASTQTPCATTSWSRPPRVTGRPSYATSWEFAAGQRIRAEGHTPHDAKGTAGREPQRSLFPVATAAAKPSRGRPPRRQEHLTTTGTFAQKD